MKNRILLLLVLFIGCSDPRKELLEELKKNQPTPKSLEFIDIKAFELVGSMNESIDGEIHFSFSPVDEYDNVIAYRDKKSSLVMTTMGTEGKYSMIEIIMPLKDFLSDKKSDEGAVRFCHCARRMAKAIDADLEKPVEKLVNENIEKAISTKDGVFMGHEGMIIKFNCNKLGNVKFVNFVIGVPD